MRTKSLLHEVQTYLKSELELSQLAPKPTPSPTTEKSPVYAAVSDHQKALAQKVEADRSRLLREVEIEARQEHANEHVPFKRVLVAVDSSPQAMAAIDLAVRLGLCGEVKYALVHVIDDAAGMYEGFAAPVSIVGEKCLLKEKASILLKSAAERFSPHGRGMDEAPMPQVEQIIREGPVVSKVIEAAREFGADLIIVGTHARRGISYLLMGSTAEGVIRMAPCPVMSVSTKAEKRDETK